MSERVTTSDRPAAPEAPAAATSRVRHDVAFFLIAAAVFALDQSTKWLVRATVDRGDVWPDGDWVLRIINVSNSGAAFGILKGQTTFLLVTSLVGVAAIVLYYVFPPLEHGLLRAALGLQLGGAAGNMIDRARSGEVTDFLKFEISGIIDWPAFNVADASIFIGVATIIGFLLIAESERWRAKPDEP